MLTQLTSQLKQYIEQHINEINKNQVYASIQHCPLDILADYLEVLNSIDVTPNKNLYPYVDIATYLATQLYGAECNNVTISLPHGNTYEFTFPEQNFDFGEIQRNLNKLCPQHYVGVESVTSFSNYPRKTTVRVIVRPLGQFKF